MLTIVPQVLALRYVENCQHGEGIDACLKYTPIVEPSDIYKPATEYKYYFWYVRYRLKKSAVRINIWARLVYADVSSGVPIICVGTPDTGCQFVQVGQRVLVTHFEGGRWVSPNVDNMFRILIAFFGTGKFIVEIDFAIWYLDGKYEVIGIVANVVSRPGAPTLPSVSIRLELSYPSRVDVGKWYNIYVRYVLDVRPRINLGTITATFECDYGPEKGSILVKTWSGQVFKIVPRTAKVTLPHGLTVFSSTDPRYTCPGEHSFSFSIKILVGGRYSGRLRLVASLW